MGLFSKNKGDLFIRCNHCGYTTKVTKELFAKILGAATVGFGFKAWVGFLFAGTGFAMAICIAILAGGVAMMAYAKTIVEWLNKRYSCPQCSNKSWDTYEESELELLDQKEQEDNMKEFFGGEDTVVYFDEKIRIAFEAGIKHAQSEIAIAVPFINKSIISEKITLKETLQSLIVDALKRNVKVKILYGMKKNTSDDPTLQQARQDMKSFFTELRHLSKNLKIKEGNVHSKVVIYDKKYMLTGSFNYLSFGGKYDKNTRKEATNAHYEQKRIEPFYEEYFNF